MYNPNEDIITQNIAPTTAPAITAGFGVGVGVGVGGGSGGGGSGGGDVEGIKSFVHIYSLLLLISSNKISFSID